MSALVGALHRARATSAQQEEQTDQLRRSKVYFNSAGKNSIFISPKMREALKGKAAPPQDELLAVSEKNDPKKRSRPRSRARPTRPAAPPARVARRPGEPRCASSTCGPRARRARGSTCRSVASSTTAPRGLWCLKFQPLFAQAAGSPDARRATSRVHADIASARATMREKLEASGYGRCAARSFDGGRRGGHGRGARPRLGRPRCGGEPSTRAARRRTRPRALQPHEKLQHLVVQEGHERSRARAPARPRPLARGMAADGYWGALRQASEKSDAARRLGTNSQLGSLSAAPLPATRESRRVRAGAAQAAAERGEPRARRDAVARRAWRPRTGTRPRARARERVRELRDARAPGSRGLAAPVWSRASFRRRGGRGRARPACRPPRRSPRCCSSALAPTGPCARGRLAGSSELGAELERGFRFTRRPYYKPDRDLRR